MHKRRRKLKRYRKMPNLDICNVIVGRNRNVHVNLIFLELHLVLGDKTLEIAVES